MPEAIAGRTLSVRPRPMNDPVGGWLPVGFGRSFAMLLALMASGSLCWLPLPSAAGFITTAVLRDYCDADDRVLKHQASGSDTHDAMVCLSYVAGVHDAMRGVLFCTPDAFDNGQAADLIKRYLKEHPERGGESASRVVSDALVKAYPCKNKGVDL